MFVPIAQELLREASTRGGDRFSPSERDAIDRFMEHKPQGVSSLCAIEDPLSWTSSIPHAKFSRMTEDFSLDGLLRDEKLSTGFKAIGIQLEKYQKNGIPKIRRALAKIAGILNQANDPLSPEILEEIHQEQVKIVQETSKASSKIGDILSVLSDRMYVSQRRLEILQRLSKFLTHDISNMLPDLSLLDNFKEVPEVLQATATQAIRALYNPEWQESFIQVVSFPVGIIPNLFALANHQNVPLEEVNLFGICTVSAACTVLRTLKIELSARTIHLQSLPPLHLPFRVASDQTVTPTGEGFFVLGDQRLKVKTYPFPLIGSLYGTIKNAVFAIGDHYNAEDPYPERDTDVAAWEERQRDRVYQAQIRLVVRVDDSWRDRGLGKVSWISIEDSAGGFNLNQTLNLAFTLLQEALSHLLNVSASEVKEALNKSSLESLPPLIQALGGELGLQDLGLVEKIFDAYRNSARSSHLTVGEIMHLASIFRLSGKNRSDFTSSGFGLFGLRVMETTGTFVHDSHVNAGNEAGTTSVFAVQPPGGLLCSPGVIRGFLESAA